MKTEKHPGTWNKGYPKAQETKAKAGKWNSIKLKSFRKLSSVWRKKKKTMNGRGLADSTLKKELMNMKNL